MTEMPQPVEQMPPHLSDWQRLAHRRGPNLLRLILASMIAAGVMLYVSPVVISHSVVISAAAVLLSPVIFMLGWMAGIATFSRSCQSFRRLHRTWSLSFLLPGLLAATVGLGLLGGRYWWLFSSGLAFFGHRKGTKRAWWSAVVCLAFSFRNDLVLGMGTRPIAENDEDALAKAIVAVNKEIGLRRE